jgi:hypothetical protein
VQLSTLTSSHAQASDFSLRKATHWPQKQNVLAYGLSFTTMRLNPSMITASRDAALMGRKK